MIIRARPFGATLTLLIAAVAFPVAAGTEPPPYLTHWGTVGSGNGEFRRPFGAAADAGGNVYITDRENHRVQKFTVSGTFLLEWGSLGSGPGQFVEPFGIAIDAFGNVYVADTSNHRIEKFSSMGTYLAEWGSFGPANGQFDAPVGVATDADGNVYVTDAKVSTKVTDIPVPDDANVPATYAGLVVKSSKQPEAAQAFLTWFAGPDGQAILSSFGFLPPS